MNKSFSIGEFIEDGPTDFTDNSLYRFTVFSDLHYGYYNYNIFRCTLGMQKLQAILEDSKKSDFYINLGDFADNLQGETDLPYKELEEMLSKYKIVFYNQKNKISADEKYIYSVIGNHEAAYKEKKFLSKYIPCNDEFGNVYSFSIKNTAFLAYDALFSAADLSDKPESIISTLSYSIPDKTLSYAKELLEKEVLKGAKSIIAFTHISNKNITEPSKTKLLQMLSSFNLPITIFEGHAHMQNYQIYNCDNGNSVQVFTLPAVTDYDRYCYYEVIMKDNSILRINTIFKPINQK